MTDPFDWTLVYAAGLPVWFPTYRVWITKRGRHDGMGIWYTGDPQHKYGVLVKYLEGLPVDDGSQAAHDTAAAVFRAAGLLTETA